MLVYEYIDAQKEKLICVCVYIYIYNSLFSLKYWHKFKIKTYLLSIVIHQHQVS
jgi:hypothetical protein